MEFSVEFYKENNMFCAYISGEGMSGISVKASTSAERTKQVSEHLANLSDEYSV